MRRVLFPRRVARTCGRRLHARRQQRLSTAAKEGPSPAETKPSPTPPAASAEGGGAAAADAPATPPQTLLQRVRKWAIGLTIASVIGVLVEQQAFMRKDAPWDDMVELIQEDEDIERHAHAVKPYPWYHPGGFVWGWTSTESEGRVDQERAWYDFPMRGEDGSTLRVQAVWWRESLDSKSWIPLYLEVDVWPAGKEGEEPINFVLWDREPIYPKLDDVDWE